MWPVLTIFVFLFAAYIPLTQGYFLVSRDYWGFVYEHSNFSNSLLFNAEGDTAAYGRPLAGYVMSFFHSLATTIEGANFVRGALILCLVFSAYLFHLWLRLHHIGKANSVLISVAIFTLPPFQSNASSISQAPVTLSLLLSIYACLFLYRSLYSFGVGFSSSRWIAYASVTVMLLFISLVTYPLSAMFFWPMLAVLIGRLKPLTVIRKRAQIFLAFCIPSLTLGIYFVFFRLTQNVLQETALSFHPIDRLLWFINQPFLVALNLWNINESSLLFIPVGIVLCGGLLLGIAADIRQASPKVIRSTILKYACTKYVLLISLFPLSVLPMVASKYNFLSFRHLVALSPLLFLAFVWSAAHVGSLLAPKGKTNILTAGLLLICFYGIWTAHVNVQDNIVIPLSAELKYFKNIISRHEPSETKTIHVIASAKRHRTLLPNYEEFAGFQSALGIPYDGAFNPALVFAAIKELAHEDNRFAAERKKWNIGRAVDAVTYSSKEDFEKQRIVSDLKNTVVIDMTEIEFLVGAEISQKNEHLISAEKSEEKSIANPNQCKGGIAISGGDYPGFPAFQAFDGDSINTRWASQQTGLKTAGAAYIGYDFGGGKKKHIRQLSIRQGGAITSVKIQRSDDGKLWRDVAILALQADNNSYLHNIPPSQAARFWRVLANGNTGAGPSAWAVYEIEMMEQR